MANRQNGRNGRKGNNQRIEPRISKDFGQNKLGDLDISLGTGDRVAGGEGAKKAGSTQKSKRKSAPSVKTSARKSKPKTSQSRKAAGAKKKRGGSQSNGGFFKFMKRATYWSFVMGIWGFIAVIGILGYYAWQLPSASTWKVPDRPPNVRIVAVDGSLIGNRGLTGGENVPLHQMPKYLPEAVIAIEDRRFYSHFGFDPIGFTRAMITNVQAGRTVQGGSTLTQQLAKNLFLTPERTLDRKIQELILAFWLEASYTKDEILDMYLNRVYLGAGTYGVDAASRRYFKKTAREVNLGEAAILAGLLKAPSRYAPTRDLERSKRRAQTVLASMEKYGFISAKERKVALTLPSSAPAARKSGAQNYVADWIMQQLPKLVGELSDDVIVDTTIDKHLQAFAQQALKDGLDENGKRLGAEQGALVSIDGIGAVRALVGGRDYGESQYNRATNSRRQPGSSFKPFVYLAAVEWGARPETRRYDQPISINGWTPKNYSKKYMGEVSLVDSLALSLNTVSAVLTSEVGANSVVETAKRMGIESPLKANPSISLGTSEVTPLELAAAYVPFANGGFRISPHVIKRVTTYDGKVLYERPTQGHAYKQVMNPEHLGMMNFMMTQTLVRGTGKKAALKNWPAGGKTGTSQDFRDAWFAGYTANLTTVVWIGNDDNSPTKKASGGNLPAIVWKQFMEEAHQGIAVADLPGRYGQNVFAGNLPSNINNPTPAPRPDAQVPIPLEPQVRGIGNFLKSLFNRS